MSYTAEGKTRAQTKSKHTCLALLESDVPVGAKLTPDVKRNEQRVADKCTV